MSETTAWPSEIRLDKGKTVLKVDFSDNRSFSFTAEFLRVLSPSAEVQGHTPSQKQTVPGKKDVKISKIEQVGNYAIRITFDDGHDTGLYSWPYLYELGENYETKWAEHLEDLAQKGLSR